MTDKLRDAVATVLTNVSNYPKRVQPRVLGESLGPLIDRVTEAVRSVLAEQGEPEWEYGSAVREANGVVWDHEFFTKDPTTAAQLRAWSEEHSADGWDDSTIVAVRRSIPRVEVWEPVEENTPHTEGNER